MRINYTPGPWQAEDLGRFGCKVVAPPHRHPQSAEYVIAHIPCITIEQQEANARAISAVPQLIDCLVRVRGHMPELPALLIQDIEIALKKAGL